ARNLINFLNSDAPDLGLPEGDSQIINAGGARGKIEDNLEDKDGGSVADRAHAGDNGFEGGSLDFGDEVVIDTGIQTTPVDLGGPHTLLSYSDQATDNVFGQQLMGISTHPILVEESSRPSRGESFTRSHHRMEL
ncbi:hypothetical protein VP01_12212g1, partial [Puccinia sorghi]